MNSADVPLLQAFREFGPLEPEPTRSDYADAPEYDEALVRVTATNERRTKAARVLIQTLTELGNRVRGFDKADIDDAVQTVARRLMQNGPRGKRQGDPRSGAHVRNFLGRAIRNALLDRIEHTERHAQLPEAAAAFQATPGAIDVIEFWAAWDELFDEIVPVVAASKPTLATSVQQMRGIVLGQTDFQSVVDVEAEDGDDRNQVATRLYQRYRRTSEALLKDIEAREANGETTPERAELLRAIARGLRLRTGGSPA